MPGDRREWLLLLLLCAAPLVAYFPAWHEGRLLAPGAGAVLDLPLRVEVFRAWRGGDVPSWNESIFSGTPLLASYRPGALHPLMLALAALPPFTAFQALVLFPELGGEWLRLGSNGLEAHSLPKSIGNIADVARLSDGRLLLVTRQFGLSGIIKHLVEAKRGGTDMFLRPIAQLNLGARDNIEAIAAEARAGGGTRLWMMTDNDFRPRKATLLVALDLP